MTYAPSDFAYRQRDLGTKLKTPADERFIICNIKLNGKETVYDNAVDSSG